MTELRLTRRRALSILGGLGVGTSAFAAIPPRSVSASVTTHEWIMRVNSRDIRVHDVESFEPAVRKAVRDAIEGGYAATDPPAALRELFDIEIPTYVRVDGQYYRLEPTFPIYEVWIEPVSKSAADDPVTLDELEKCRNPDPRIKVTPPIARADRPHRTYYLEPRLRSCIEDHPYLELGDDYYRYRVAVDDPGAPYTMEADWVSPQVVANVEGPVVRWSNVPSDARNVLLAARQSGTEGDGSVTRETVPESLRTLAAEYDWVRRGERFYEVDLDHAGAVPIEVDVTVPDPTSREFDPAVLELSVTNAGNQSVHLSTGPPAPFGILQADRLGDETKAFDLTLWTREYVESGYISTRAGRVRTVAMVGIRVTLEPGETRTQRYAVRRNPSRLSPGTYRVEEGFAVVVGERHSDNRSSFPFEIEITVE